MERAYEASDSLFYFIVRHLQLPSLLSHERAGIPMSTTVQHVWILFNIKMVFATRHADGQGGKGGPVHTSLIM